MQKSDCIIGVEHVSKFFGKTTLLRLIAGFQTASEGVITIAGKDITQTPPHKRPVNTVFQKYALFPHLNVFNNIAFGLKLKKLPGATIEKKVKQALPLRRAAAARSHCPSYRQRTRSAAAGRTPCRPGPKNAQGHADGAKGDAPEAGHHLRICDPRPGRGTDLERYHRRDERRTHPANRRADGHLQRTHQLLRSRLHW